jgi:hypothetical protein
MKRHILFFAAILLILAVASPAWAGNKYGKVSRCPGIHMLYSCGMSGRTVKSLRAYRGLWIAYMRSHSFRFLPPEEAGTPGKETGESGTQK